MLWVFLKCKKDRGGSAKRAFLVQVLPILVSEDKILFTMTFALSLFHLHHILS